MQKLHVRISRVAPFSTATCRRLQELRHPVDFQDFGGSSPARKAR